MSLHMSFDDENYLGNCVICGEAVRSDDDPAEMHNPSGPDSESGLCHAECGLGRGWQVS